MIKAFMSYFKIIQQIRKIIWLEVNMM